jgi:ABC-type bacteriocin/lantibiotic exporter with double-glycine peptidase domain
VRANVFGWEWLPSFGAIEDGDKRGLTKAVLSERVKFREVAPVPGAIATVWRGRLCTHVAVVVEIDNRLGVLETNPSTGPRWLSVADFERNYMKVIYYHDR